LDAAGATPAATGATQLPQARTIASENTRNPLLAIRPILPPKPGQPFGEVRSKNRANAAIGIHNTVIEGKILEAVNRAAIAVLHNPPIWHDAL
jgi:hypothetical protein